MACKGLIILLGIALASGADSDSTVVTPVPSQAQIAEWNFALAMQEFNEAFNHSEWATKQAKDRAAQLKGQGSQLAKKIEEASAEKFQEQLHTAEATQRENLEALQHSIAAEETVKEADEEQLKADKADAHADKASKILERASERAQHAKQEAQEVAERARNKTRSAETAWKAAAKDQEAEVEKLLKESWDREVAETKKDAAKQAKVEKSVEDRMQELQRKKADAAEKLKKDKQTISENHTAHGPVVLDAFPTPAQRQRAEDMAVKKSVGSLVSRIEEQAKELANLKKAQARSIHGNLEEMESRLKAESEKLGEDARRAAEDVKKKARFTLSVGAAAGKNMTLLRSGDRMQRSADLQESAKEAQEELKKVTDATLKNAKHELERAAKEMERKAEEDEKDIAHHVHGLSKQAHSAEKMSKKDEHKEAKYSPTAFLASAQIGFAQLDTSLALIGLGLAAPALFLVAARQGTAPVRMPTEALG